MDLNKMPPDARRYRYAAMVLILLLVAPRWPAIKEHLFPATPGVVRADPVDLIIIGVVLLLEVAALYLSKPKSSSIARDDKPTTLSSRGSFVPLLIGRRRLGAVFGAAGNRSTKKEKVAGAGKGGLFGSSPKQTVYYESGWHMICVGPMAKLHRIYQSGKVIFQGPITPYSHPSGTTVDLGREGSFRIYWGEADQPLDSGLAALTGVDSAWPYTAGVYWVRKRLGTTAQWQLIDYEVEARPVDPQLTASQPWIEATRTLNGTPRSPLLIYDHLGHLTAPVVNGAPRTARFRVSGHHATEYKPGSYVLLSGNTGAANRDLRVFEATNGTVTVWVSTDPVTHEHVLITYEYTDVVFDNALSGANQDGTIEQYVTNEDDGVNPAHALDQLLFQEHPHGRGLDRTLFDVESLEVLGVTLQTERVPCSVLAKDGENADSLVASLMQDYGFLLAPDPSTGLIRAKLVRKDASPVALTDDVLLDPKPEIATLREERPTDRMQFEFSDRNRAFKDNAVIVDDDSQSIARGVPRTRSLSMPTVIDWETGQKVAQRRGQEALTGQQKFKLFGHKSVRLMFPGQAFTTPDFASTLRLVGVKRDVLTGRVELEATKDYYGADVSTYSGDEGTIFEPATVYALADLAFTLVEVPAYLGNGTKQMVVVVPRIRADDSVVQADIYFSSDDSTYNQVGTETDFQTGGSLIDAIAATDAWEIATGPTFTALGPDIDTVEDFSSDETSWRLGRQLAVINGEVFFLKKVTALGGSTYRLDGLLRARYDTVRGDHAVGDTVFIFSYDRILQITDALLIPDTTIYVKTQPSAGESLSLDDSEALTVTLHGKGVKPMDIQGLRTADSSSSYKTGNDVVHNWEYQSALSPGTGAGLQNAGGPTGSASVDGTFTVTIKNSGGSTIRTITGLTTPTYTYTAALRTTDGLEGSNYRIAVVNVSGGYSSDSVELLVTHVT